jgi:SAM-dependent methyltransferase
MMAPCPLCGAASEGLAEHRDSVTSEARRLGAPSALRGCLHCGHLFTQVPSLALDAYYANSYDATLTDGGADELVATPDGGLRFRTDLDTELLVRALGPALHADSRVIELGSGRGRILSRLKALGLGRLSAFDVGTRYREPLSTLVGADQVFIGQRPEGTWDVGLSFFVLEHDTRPLESLRWFREHLVPGGALFIALPNPETNRGDLACADHLHHYPPAFFEELAQSLGFEIRVRDLSSSVGASLWVLTNTRRPERPFGGPAFVTAARDVAAPHLKDLAQLRGLEAQLPPGRAVWLYGAGFYASLAASALGRPLAGIADANPRKVGQQRLGHTVISPEALARPHPDDALVVCINPRLAPEVALRFTPHFAQVLTLAA